MTAKLVKAYGLNSGQLQDIRQLAEACNHAEGLTMRLNWSLLQGRPRDQANDFMYYEGGRLIGFLGLYQWVPEEAEASAMTHPDYRRQGIFRQLLAEGRAEPHRRGTLGILFFAERKSPAVPAVIRATCAAYRHTENLMHAGVENLRLYPLLPGLDLRLATLEDLPELQAIDEEAFDLPAGENHYVRESLEDPRQNVWVVTFAGTVVGKIQGRVAEGENRIYGFATKSRYRGKGYGKAALSEAMRRLLEERRQKFSLEVLTHNEQALGLYRSHGFDVVTAYDYYSLPVV